MNNIEDTLRRPTEELRKNVILGRKYIKDVLEIEVNDIRPYRDDMDIGELKYVMILLTIKMDIIAKTKDCKMISFNEWKKEHL